MFVMLRQTTTFEQIGAFSWTSKCV